VVILERTIIAFSSEGAGTCCGEGEGTLMLSCCDLFGNAGGDWVGCVAEHAGLNGNFSSDPMFCNPADGDFRLLVSSPCADGSSDCGLIGAWSAGCR
jgi:hypothetical protein